MTCARIYTVAEIGTILHQSEGRTVPGKPDCGHTIGRHVGIQGEGLSDRLMRAGPSGPAATVFSQTGRALILAQDGHQKTVIKDGVPQTVTLTQKDYVDSWQNYDLNDAAQRHWVAQYKNPVKAPPGTKNLNSHFDANINRGSVPLSGSFMDIQQAIAACTATINLPEWQTRLATLDVANPRVTSLTRTEPIPASLGGSGGRRMWMYLATRDASETAMAPVTGIFMLVMLLAPGQIHIQTSYPVA